jgi:hypothetical protein
MPSLVLYFLNMPGLSDWKTYSKFEKLLGRGVILLWDTSVWWYVGNPGIKIHNHGRLANFPTGILHLLHALH